MRLTGLIVIDPPYLPEKCFSLGNRIQWCIFMTRRTFVTQSRFCIPFSFFFLNVCTVFQNDGKQVCSRPGHVDRPSETQYGEAWQQSGMIHMGVGQQNEIDRFRIEIDRSIIFVICIPSTLEHAAVHQKTYFCRFNQVA